MPSVGMLTVILELPVLNKKTVWTTWQAQASEGGGQLPGSRACLKGPQRLDAALYCCPAAGLSLQPNSALRTTQLSS